MEKSILFIVPYPYNTAPSQRLKFEQYYTEFEKAGYKITVVPFINDRFATIIYKKGYFFSKVLYTLTAYINRYLLLATAGNYDIIYIHLWGTPLGLPMYERLLRLRAKKIVYDIDDLIYLAKPSPNNSFIGILKSSAKIDLLMKHADHVFVSTDKLLAYAQKFTSAVSLIPATIDVKKYTVEKAKQHDHVVIGWSGSHTTSKYLHMLDGVLAELATRHSIAIRVMGNPNFAINGLDIELLQWSAEKETDHLQSFDIGLHPLPDEEWVYGKSGGKLVQYMAAGLPIVASAVGPNFKAIKNGYNGFLVSTDDEWVEKLELLITDVRLRKQMGLNSKQYAIDHYSVEANLNRYLSVLNGL